jgi:hypothetical protein
LSQWDKGKIEYLEKNHNQTFPKKQTKKDNKVRASTRIQHTHVSKPEKIVRYLNKNTQAYKGKSSNQ